jgi:glycosyltransferase involved in cell wall biosynthesis
MDVRYFREELGVNTIDYLSLYLPAWQPKELAGMGSYCLYHADLSVSANEQTAVWLLKNIFQKIQIPFVIAGKNPSAKLQELAHKVAQTCIVVNPSETEMQDMISKAHINILPSTITTGIKIKLVNALFNGRHLIVNDAAVSGTMLGGLCHIRNKAAEMETLISQLYHQPFPQDDAEKRRELLLSHFNNQQNALQQVKWIWG